jgi:purine nucleosidase
VAFVAQPGLFRLVPARVQVETAGRLTSGMTVTDFGAEAHNALVAMSVDAPGFWDMVIGALHRTAAHMDGA